MATSGGEESDLLKRTKFFIRSTLISSKEGVLASRFMHDYQEFAGHLPFKELGYSSVADLMKAVPDVVYVKTVSGQLTYFAVADETTQHIHSLIQRQKSNPKKNKALKKGTSRFPKQQFRNNQSFGSHGGHRSGPPPPFRTTASRVSGFAHSKPSLSAGGRSPILSTPSGFSAADVSPLTVTVRNRVGSGEDERTIAKRKAGSSSQYVVNTLNSALKDRKPLSSNSRTYDVPPRFRKIQGGGSAASGDQPDKPVAVVQPSQKSVHTESAAASETGLPRNVKSWTKELSKDYRTGLWSTRFTVLYEENFGQEAPGNIMDILQTWTDIVHVEFMVPANRYLIFPVAETSTASSPASRIAELRASDASAMHSSHSQPQWENFNVPLAQLFEVKEVTEVYASFSRDLNHFYLQREDSCADDITVTLMGIQSKLAVPKASDLQPGVFCAALYSLDQSWYRARVLFLHDDKEVQVFFIDYGNAEKVAISDIRCLTPDTAAIPAQAVGCVMFALRPFEGEQGWSDATKTTFASLMADKKLQAHTVKIEDGSCVVELWSDDSDKSLNEQLYNQGLVDTYLPKNFDLPEVELPQDEYSEVVVAYVDLMHCWLRLIGQDYSEKLEQFEDRLTVLYSQFAKQPKRIEEGSICIAHAEYLYHRVKVKELGNNQANCFYVDHGYTEWIPLDQLVPLDTNENQSLPYQALQCVLMGLEDYMSNPTTITELVERSRNKICVAEFIDRDPLKVMLFDTHGKDDVNINEEIAKKLVSEGHSVNLSQFSSGADSGPELSRGSSPRPSSANPTSQPDMEALQSVTKRLTLDPDGLAASHNDSANRSERSSAAESAAQKTERILSQDLSETSAQALRVSPLNVGGSSPYSDSMCVVYDTWPLPAYLPMPEIGQFFDVFIQSVADPSNFVIVPLNGMAMLENTMEEMNTQFNADCALQKYGDASQVQTPTQVPTPQANHLYMTEVNGVFKRAIFLSNMGSMLHVLLPDFCEYELLKPSQLFFLPKKFWSMPFTAFRACLHGVKPAGVRGDSGWSESAKFSFLQLTLHTAMVALLKDIIGKVEVSDKGDLASVSKQKLSLHLVNTSNPDVDIIVDEHLVAAGLAFTVTG